MGVVASNEIQMKEMRRNIKTGKIEMNEKRIGKRSKG